MKVDDSVLRRFILDNNLWCKFFAGVKYIIFKIFIFLSFGFSLFGAVEFATFLLFSCCE